MFSLNGSSSLFAYIDCKKLSHYFLSAPYPAHISCCIYFRSFYLCSLWQGQGKNEYVVTYYQAKKSADFSQSHYDWANMLPDYRYPGQATPAEIDAVALLMNDVPSCPVS